MKTFRIGLFLALMVTFLFPAQGDVIAQTQTPNPESPITAPPVPPTGWTRPLDLSDGTTRNWRAFPTMVCDQYQNLHIFYADNPISGSAGEGAAVYYRNDTPGDGKFTSPEDIMALRDPRIYSLAAAVSNKSDRLFVVWTSQTPGTLYFMTALLSEAQKVSAWSIPVKLDYLTFNANIKVDSKGIVHLFYSTTDQNALKFDVFHIQSEDDGATWSDPDPVYSYTFPEPGYIRIETSIDSKDRIHMGLTVRYQAYGTYSEVGYTRSEDGGKTWTPYVKFEDKRYPGVEWITPFAFEGDEIHLTWHDPRRIHIVSNDGGKTWSEPEDIMRMGAAFGGPNYLVKDNSKNLYALVAISYGVFVTRWDGTSWVESQQIDTRQIDPHGQQMVVCGGNKLHVVYWDRTGETSSWYSMRELSDVPALARKPIPEVLPTASPTARATQILIPTETVEEVQGVNQNTTALPAVNPIPPESMPSPILPMIIGIGSVLILIVGVVIYSTYFRRT